ncbi:MAG: hypothetical protein QXT63_00120 [Thermoplasmata archaeon]
MTRKHTLQVCASFAIAILALTTFNALLDNFSNNSTSQKISKLDSETQRIENAKDGFRGISLEARHQTGTDGVPSTPVIGELHLAIYEKHPEIIYGTDRGYLTVIQKLANNTINLVWSQYLDPIPSDSYTSAVFAPAIADIDDDQYGEIVVYAYSGESSNTGYYNPTSCGKVYAINHDGTILWNTSIGAPPQRNGGSHNMWADQAPCIGEIDGDGTPDVALILGDGYCHAFSGKNGTILWERQVGSSNPGFYIGKTAILDLDMDGNNEVICAGGTLRVFRKDGSTWWTGLGADFGVADLNLDGKPEVVTTVTSTGLYVYNNTGSIVWTRSNNVLGSGVTISDFDLDGMPEIAFGTYSGHVIAYNYDGSIQWDSGNLGVGEWDNPDLTSTDLNGDNSPEVTVQSDDWGGLVLDGLTGAVLANIGYSVNENEHSPAIADVDNDGHAEIVVPSGYWGGATYPFNILILGNDAEWVATRPVWNQMAYYASHVDNALRVTGDYTPWLGQNNWRCQLPNLKVTISSNPATISSQGTSTITVMVSNGTAGVKNAEVYLQCVNGGLSSYNGITDESGYFRVTYQAPSVDAQTLGTINAVAYKYGYNEGGAATNVTVLPASSTNLIGATVTCRPESVTSGSSVWLTVRVTHYNNPVQGATVQFVCSQGGTFTPMASYTDANGILEATFTPTPTNYRRVLLVNITCKKAGYIDGTTQTQIIEYPASRPCVNLTIAASPAVVSQGGVSTITCYAKNGTSPIQGATIYLSAPSGMLSNTSGITDANGRFSAIFYPPLATVISSYQISAVAVYPGLENGEAFTTVTVMLGNVLSVSVWAGTATLQSGSTTTIFVRVMNGTQLVSGATVNMNVSKGSISPTNADTNSDGIASFTYTAPTVSANTTVYIRASASKSGFASGTSEVELHVTPLPSLTLTLTGENYMFSDLTSLFSLLVTGTGGFVVSGATIQLSTTTGSTTPPSGVSSTDGTFSFTYLAPHVSSQIICRIVATASAPGYVSAQGEFEIVIVPRPVITVEISASNEVLFSGESTNILVNVSTSSGRLANALVTIECEGGTLVPSTGITNPQGQFTCTYSPPMVYEDTPIMLYANATFGEYIPGHATIAILVKEPPAPPPILNATLTVEPSTSRSCVNKTVTVCITNGTTGQPVAGAAVAFAATCSGTFAPQNVITDSSGCALTYFQPSAVQSDTIVKIYANCTKYGYIADSKNIQTIVTPASLSLEVTANPSIVPKIGTSDIVVSVIDDLGTPVAGASLILSSEPGKGVLHTTVGTTDAFGKFTTKFTAPTVAGLVCNISVIAGKNRYNGAKANVSVTVSDKYMVVNITSSKDRLVSSSSTTITVSVYDSTNTPLSGATVNLATTGGSIYPSSIMTDDSGLGSATFTAPAVSTLSTCRVYANVSAYGFDSVSVFIDIIVEPIGLNITMSLSPAVMLPNSDAQVLVKVTDSTGAIISGANIVLSCECSGSLNAGTLSRTSGVTDIRGEFSAVYTSPYVTETFHCSITATATLTGYTPATYTLPVTVDPAAPKNLYITIDSESIGYSGEPLQVTFIAREGTSSGIPVQGVQFSITTSYGDSLSGTSDAYGRLMMNIQLPSVGLITFITINATGTKTNYNPGNASKEVQIRPLTISTFSLVDSNGVKFDKVTLTVGNTLRVYANATDNLGRKVNEIAVTYSISPTNIASIDSSGLITAKKSGTGSINAEVSYRGSKQNFTTSIVIKNKEEKTSDFLLPILIGIVAAVAVIGLVFFIFMRKKDEDNRKKNKEMQQWQGPRKY